MSDFGMGLLVGGLASFALLGGLLLAAIFYASYRAGQTARVQRENAAKVSDAMAEGFRTGIGKAISDSAEATREKIETAAAARAGVRGAPRRPRRNGH